MKRLAQIAKSILCRLPTKRLVILGYHRIRNQQQVGADTISTLKAQVETLQLLGYQFITVREFAEEGVSRKKKSVILTFDDGYQDFYYVVAPVLQEYGVRATVFVVAGYVDTNHIFEWIEYPETPLDYILTSKQIVELHRSGFEIGSHTLTHPRLTELQAERVREELAQSRKLLEKIIGSRVSSFCYPQGFYNREIMQLVREAGYSAAVVSRFSSGVPYPWRPRNTMYDLARIYPYDDIKGFRRQISAGYEMFQYASFVLRSWRS